MSKYLIVAKNTWIEAFTYRLNFAMWRLRVTIELLTRYFLWLAIIPGSTKFLNYDQSQMLTYVIGTSLVEAVVLSTRTADIAQDINNGNLSNFLIKPLNYFAYWFSRDIGDKAMNILFLFFELSLFFLILKPPFFIQTNPSLLILFLIAVIIAILMHFLIGFLISLIGFWSPETWGPRFVFYIVLMFFAGWTFPLDILPKPLFNVLQYFPFGYLLYFPVKIYLGNLQSAEIYKGLFISLTWTFIIYFITKAVWQKGLKSYAAYGK